MYVVSSLTFILINLERHHMNENFFKVAGTSKSNGEVKVRFANDLVLRIKTLHRGGHTEVNLIELPTPMTKLEALKYLQQVGFTEGDSGYAVSAQLAERSRAAKRGEVKVKATKAPTANESLTTNENQTV
jgi:hypothetical protein